MISTPRKRRNGKRIALVTVLIAFLLIELALLGIVLGTIVYQKYILPRPVEYTTFAPLERKIFDLDASEIASIYFTTDVDKEQQEKYKKEHRATRAPTWYTFETEEEVEEVISYLNSFRYTHTAPGPNWRNWWKPNSPPHCYLGFSSKKLGADPRDYQVLIEENRFCIGEVWYYGDPEYFSRFMGIEAKLLDGTFSGF